MNPSRLFLLSHDRELHQQFQENLGKDYEIVECHSLAELETAIKANQAGVVMVHLSKPVLDGMSAGRFTSELNDLVKNVPIYGFIDPLCPTHLRRLVKRTADRLLPMPVDFDHLQTILSQQVDLEEDLDGFWRGMPHKELHGQTRSMVTFTPAMFGMIDDLEVAARHDVTVLLIGETGSGKTYLAQLIHELSERRDERFCTISCGALPPDLIESELFGYVKGAFTGADRDKEGKFAAAGNGTLLLDEIDALPPEQQAKLLRVIETGEYEPVGSNETRHSQARLIVASNIDLEKLVQHGCFRTDLYYRLNILNFRLLPLCQRPWDIEYLARKFALEHGRKHNILVRDIAPGFLDALRSYPWPGNIRELENVVRRAVLYCQRGVLTVHDLPSDIRRAIANAAKLANDASEPSIAMTEPMGTPIHGSRDRNAGTAGTTATSGHYGASSRRGSRNGKSVVLGGNMTMPNMPNGYEMASASSGRGDDCDNGHGNGLGSRIGGGIRIDTGLGDVVGPVPLGCEIYESREENNGYRDSDQNRDRNGNALRSEVCTEQPPLQTLEVRLGKLERRIIKDSLHRNQHQRKSTAAELGISRVTLYNKMKKFGLLD